MPYRKKHIPTVTLERQLLKFLMTNKVILQGRFTSCHEEWFTSDERFAIFDFIRKNYSRNRNVLNETQFNYLLDSSLGSEDDEQVREKVKAEYDVVMSVKIDDEVNVVISRLNEALMGTQVQDLLLGAWEDIEKGDIQAAISRMKQSVMSMSSNTDDEDDATPLWGSDSQWKERVVDVKEHPEFYAGIKTGFKKYDELTGGLFPAELYMVFGLSGKGKSTFMKQIGLNVSNQRKNVLHCANEENKQQIMSKYISNATGTHYRGWKLGTYSDEDMDKYESFNNERKDGDKGNIYVYTFRQQTDASCISRKLSELKTQGITIDLVIVDYLDLMSSVVRAYNENDEGGRVAGDLKQIAIDFNVPVLTCTQANTSAEKQETKDRPFLTMDDMFGTKRKIHSSNVVIGIVNKTATVNAGDRDEEVVRHRLTICVCKNRDGGVFAFPLVMEVKTGYVHDDDGEADPISEEQERNAKKIMEEAKLDVSVTPEEQTQKVHDVLNQLFNDKKDDENDCLKKDELALKKHQEREESDSSIQDAVQRLRRMREKHK